MDILIVSFTHKHYKPFWLLWADEFSTFYFAGLTWRDDVTQSVIKKELSKVPKIPQSSGIKNVPSTEYTILSHIPFLLLTFFFHCIYFSLNLSIIKGLRVALQTSSTPNRCSLIWTTWLSIHLSHLSICRVWILIVTSEWENLHKHQTHTVALLLNCSHCSFGRISTTTSL